MRRRDTPTVNVQGMRIDEAATALQPGNAFALEIASVDTVQALHISIASRFQLGPVVPRTFHGEAMVLCFMDAMGQLGGVPHHFLRHAAHVHARAAEPAAFNDCRFCTVLVGALRRCQAATATANTHQVEIVSHCQTP